MVWYSFREPSGTFWASMLSALRERGLAAVPVAQAAPAVMPAHVQARDIVVRTHELETYDKLTGDASDD